MPVKTYEEWERLKRPAYSSDMTAALVAAKALFVDRQILASDPVNSDGRFVAVESDVPRVYRHILFKRKGDTHGRSRPDSELAEDFQGERAERLWWLPETLKEPDRIHCHPDGTIKGATMYFYTCDVAPMEIFAVLVRGWGKRYELTTSYSLTPAEWDAKRRGAGGHPPLKLLRR